MKIRITFTTSAKRDVYQYLRELCAAGREGLPSGQTRFTSQLVGDGRDSVTVIEAETRAAAILARDSINRVIANWASAIVVGELPITELPTVTLNMSSTAGNVFAVASAAFIALKNAGRDEEAEEMASRLLNGGAASFAEALRLVRRFVTVVDSSGRF